MRRLFIVLLVLGLGLGGQLLPRTASAIEWPPLLGCADVTGDGPVSGADIGGVVAHFGTSIQVPANYLLLYDLNGGGAVTGGDIATAVGWFGTTCPLVDTQIAQATLAVLRYRDQGNALADGYVQGTQNIAGHGVHWINQARLLDGVLDLTKPEGLNYTAGGQLIAVYYVDAMWMPGHEQPPEGFDGTEDMWHHHKGLCQWQGANGPMVAENVAQDDCLSRPGGVWFAQFGWMLHLWNFLSNPMGRFMMENPYAG